MGIEELPLLQNDGRNLLQTLHFPKLTHLSIWKIHKPGDLATLSCPALIDLILHHPTPLGTSLERLFPLLESITFDIKRTVEGVVHTAGPYPTSIDHHGIKKISINEA